MKYDYINKCTNNFYKVISDRVCNNGLYYIYTCIDLYIYILLGYQQYQNDERVTHGS